MLDLVKLTAQVTELSQHLWQEARMTQQRLQQALLAFSQLCQTPEAWQQRHDQSRQQLIFTAAVPIEPLPDPGSSLSSDPWIDVEPYGLPHTVVATDGSQINPNHHEIAFCSLINVGRVALHYGRSCWPLLDSIPVLLYRSSEEAPTRHLGSEEYLALKRTQSEMEELVQLALAVQPRETVLALIDGSLIHWNLEGLPQEEQQQWLQPLLEVYGQFQAARIPIVGYISASRSSEVTNYLRLGLCPYLSCDCHRYCQEERTPPCLPFRGLTDRVFWGSLLKPGQRSPIWRSGARLLQHYGDHTIHCCYLHVGEEIARLEFPAWVAEDRDLLDQALRMVLAQTQKGLGYPVALAEAHHLAVVRGGDRQRFFALVEQELIRTGLTHVAVSRKEARKRTGIA